MSTLNSRVGGKYAIKSGSARVSPFPPVSKRIPNLTLFQGTRRISDRWSIYEPSRGIVFIFKEARLILLPKLTIHIEQTVEHHEMGNQKTDQVSQTISADEQHWDTKARPFDDEV